MSENSPIETPENENTGLTVPVGMTYV